MKAGKIIRTFHCRDGRRVVLRTPKWEDLDDLLETINSLVDERANIVLNKRVTREAEIDWLAGALSRLERDEVIYVVAEVDGKAVANSELRRKQSGCDKHVGSIGIAIKKGFRDAGIGTEMMKALIEQGRAIDLKVLTLSAFENNKRAIHVYEKLGFKQTGLIPKKFFKRDKYVNEVIMTMFLE